MKKRVLAAILILVMMFGITCCGIRQDTGQVKITMYLWDKSMTRAFTPWLEAQFPDIDFTFVIGYNSMDYYKDLNERGALPDIITCRRFSLNDAAQMSDNCNILKHSFWTDNIQPFFCQILSRLT